MNLDQPITVGTHLAALKMEYELILRKIKTAEHEDRMMNYKIVDMVVEHLEKEIHEISEAFQSCD